MSKANKFPTEQVPQNYDQEIMTRMSESIFNGIGLNSDDLSDYSKSTNERLDNLEGAVDGIVADEKQRKHKGGGGLPEPEGLKVIKVPNLPLVVAWCKPLELIKYPSARGFQFFGSVESDFTPLAESSIVTYTGTCKATHLTQMRVTATKSTKWLGLYSDLPWWHDMGLSAGTTGIINVTQSTTGTITSWDDGTPLTLVTNIAWTNGDSYRFSINRPRNLIGQGPLPFCVHVVPWDDTRFVNSRYDGQQYYVKCRTRGKHGYSQFAYTASKDISGNINTPTVNAVAKFLGNKIIVNWTPAEDLIDFITEVDHFKVYRTTANDTAMTDDETYMISGGSKAKRYVDSVAEGDIEEDVTYWYWVRTVNNDGTQSDAGVDSAKLGKPSDPVIFNGEEEGTRGFGILKDWKIQWYIPDDAKSSWVKRRRKFGVGDYGLWSLWKHSPFSKDNGTEAGEWIQQFTFHNLLIGKTYQFGVKSTNNILVPELGSDWVTEEYTISNTLKPEAPT